MRPTRSAEPGTPVIRNHLYEVVVDCENPGRLAEFYSELLDVEVIERSDSWAYLVPSVRGAQAHAFARPTGDGCALRFNGYLNRGGARCVSISTSGPRT